LIIKKSNTNVIITRNGPENKLKNAIKTIRGYPKKNNRIIIPITKAAM
jgi:hypothetical protein